MKLQLIRHTWGTQGPRHELFSSFKAAGYQGVETGVPADEIFFTDDIQTHVDAARSAGWDAELFVSASGLIDALDRRGVNLGL